MDPLQDYEFISDNAGHEWNQRALNRLRHNDPALKELCLSMEDLSSPCILDAFDAIATNSSLEVLHLWMNGNDFFIHYKAKDRATTALRLNPSLKHIDITTNRMCSYFLDIVMASPNLEALTITESLFSTPASVEDITAIAEVLVDTKLHSLTINDFRMDSDLGVAFATSFEGNHTIKNLTMGGSAISKTGAMSFVEALPHDHSLEVIVFGDNACSNDDFDDNDFDDDTRVRLIRTLGHTPLKVLSLVSKNISQDGCSRVIRTLKENEHSFTKLDLFQDSENSPWQNEVRLEIDMLTWNNRLQVAKGTWVDQFLGQDAPSKELLFLALERAKKVDKERFFKAPNMLFYLIEAIPLFIVQAIRDGH